MHVSASLSPLNLTLVDSSQPVTSLCWLLSFNSCRRIILHFTIFSISQGLEKQNEIEKKTKKCQAQWFPYGDTHTPSPSPPHSLLLGELTSPDYVVPLHKPFKLPFRQVWLTGIMRVKFWKSSNICLSVLHFQVGDSPLTSLRQPWVGGGVIGRK